MNLIGKFISNFRDFYNDINAATLTGAIDVVVVEQPDGTFTCSPFHVRFGKLGVLRSREKVVDIEINGESLDIHMKLGESGEAFFVEEVLNDEDGNEEEIPQHLACSPIPSQEELQAWAQNQATDWNSSPSHSGSAKTFVAASIADQKETVRKLSIAAGEFRPIERNCDKSEDSSLPRSADIQEITALSSHSSSTSISQTVKRKRRKKGGQKRKGSVPKFEAKQQVEDALATEVQALTSSGKARVSQEPDFHFFSDTEVTPGCSIIQEGMRNALVVPAVDETWEESMPFIVADESRPPSPILSDTEAEQQKRLEEGEVASVLPTTPPAQSWKWGELPSPPLSRASVSNRCEKETSKEQEEAEAQRSMLSGMFSFMKKTKHLRHHQQEGGVYLSDLNAEDPEVAALYFSHSYKSVAKDEAPLEDDAESGNGPSIPQSPSSQSPHLVEWPNKCECLDVSMSLCGHLDSGISEQLFHQHLVSYDDFVANPMMIENPNLVVKVGKKFYNWRMACPLIMSLAIFRKSLPQPVVEILSSELMPFKLKEKAKTSGGYSSWFTWRRTSDQQLSQRAKVETQPTVLESPESRKSEPIEIPTEIKSGYVEEKGYAGSSSSNEESDSNHQEQQQQQPRLQLTSEEQRRVHHPLSDKYRKTLRLTSEQIARLNLKDGANEVEFSVTTAYQGTTKCKCHIYKWRYDDKVVISDIDGTITKSDVLGHVLPIVGKDWAQSGVAQLFTKIKNNGYKLLYLSARAIGQARVTRDYLRSIKQGDLSLPDGPLLLNPTSLISAFHREVIERKPEEFKISCLRDIAALFPPDGNPFYAGYGNRVNDVFAYRAVGIPIVRIFTINHKGELKHELTQTFQSSYSGMSHLVDEMFPPPISGNVTGDFGNFIFWRDPIAELDKVAL